MEWLSSTPPSNMSDYRQQHIMDRSLEIQLFLAVFILIFCHRLGHSLRQRSRRLQRRWRIRTKKRKEMVGEEESCLLITFEDYLWWSLTWFWSRTNVCYDPFVHLSGPTEAGEKNSLCNGQSEWRAQLERVPWGKISPACRDAVLPREKVGGKSLRTITWSRCKRSENISARGHKECGAYWCMCAVHRAWS